MLFHNTDPDSRRLMINALGRKWEFTYTTLVVFGGAMFASFPLYYSTSFGGAYWLWMLILLSFVVQAVSYEFRSKPGNIYGGHTYDTFLFINGLVGCVLLGSAVGMFFFGADFTVARANLAEGANPVISSWGPGHGFDVITNWRCLLLGVAVFFLARTQAALYFVNNIDDARAFGISNRTQVLANGVAFTLLFVGFLAVLFMSPGLRYNPLNADEVTPVNNVYWHNMLDMWWTIPVLLAGVVLVLFGIFATAFSTRWKKGVWFSGTGTVLVVFVLFVLAAFNDTAFLRSTTNPHSSLTLVNASSSLFTLKVMAWASLVVPVVLAYISYVWYRMNKKPLTISELDHESHTY